MAHSVLHPIMKIMPHSTPAEILASTFDELFQAHWERVNGILFRLVGDADESEDLALETFWRLHQQIQAKRAPDNPGGWLYRVALNLGYNALRAQRRRQAYEHAAGRQAFEGKLTDPGQISEQEQQRRWVRQVLNELPERSAQLLVLRHSGLSYAEIAQALQIATSSVGTLLARAEEMFARRYRALVG